MSTPILRRDKIFLREMLFHTNHGVFEHEKDFPQRFVVDFEGEIYLAPPGQSDQVRDTVRYDEVAKTIQRVVEGERYNLIEALAEAIADEVLSSHEALEVVRIRVSKPEAAVPVLCGSVGVEIFRKR
ncbi:MAG: dihydroneopterin aldolase [Pseudomonadota bacterium]